MNTNHEAGSDLGLLVRAARVERGLTQAQLGSACRLSDGAVCKVEAGSLRPTVATINAICRTLHLYRPLTDSQRTALCGAAGLTFHELFMPIRRERSEVMTAHKGTARLLRAMRRHEPSEAEKAEHREVGELVAAIDRVWWTRREFRRDLWEAAEERAGRAAA